MAAAIVRSARRGHLGVRRVGVGVLGSALDGRAEGVDAAAQPGRQDLLELGQRPGAALGEARDPGAGAQPDGDRDGLVVVEEQRGQPTTGTQPVPAVAAALSPDGVVELAQPGDVRPHGPRRDAEAGGQLGGGPLGTGAEEGEELEEPLGRVRHGREVFHDRLLNRKHPLRLGS